MFLTTHLHMVGAGTVSSPRLPDRVCSFDVVMPHGSFVSAQQFRATRSRFRNFEGRVREDKRNLINLT